MLHWWFEQNKANIDRYIQNKSEAEKAKYQHYYKRELPTKREKEKSYIAEIFRTKAHNYTTGDYANGGISWYLYGNSSISSQKAKNENPPFEGPALFKDIFSNSNSPIETQGIYSKADFKKVLTEALNSRKAIGIRIVGTKGSNAYAHWITLWGAAFDEEGNILAIYVVDNNNKENRIFPYGIHYKDGLPYLFNFPNNRHINDKYVREITTLDAGQKFFDEWFAKHP